MPRLDLTTPVFPNNVVLLLKSRIEIDLPLGGEIHLRPLRRTDPNISIGLFASIWNPVEESIEMRAQPSNVAEPTIETYIVIVQCLYKHMDEEEGLSGSSVLSEWLRSMLYRDEPLRVGLATLTTSVGGVQKRFKKFRLGSQRYLSNEVGGSFAYLSTLEFTFETETY